PTDPSQGMALAPHHRARDRWTFLPPAASDADADPRVPEYYPRATAVAPTMYNTINHNNNRFNRRPALECVGTVTAAEQWGRPAIPAILTTRPIDESLDASMRLFAVRRSASWHP
ncbi:MAG: hypothetical protein Q9159_002926, partial [Coniocarpon cinnabarinum]